MSGAFAGRRAIVTGATSGIGAATARRLAGGGAEVLATGRRTDRLHQLAEELGSACRTATLDMTDMEAVAAFAAEEGAWADILVNNAGLALGVAPADKALLSDWDRMIDTNIRGLVHLTHGLLPELKAKPRGDIINISSIASTYPYPGGNVYGGTKAFVTQFSLNLRAELLGSKVRVTSVEPGLTETEFSIVRLAGDETKASSIYEGADNLTADDIARVVGDVLALPPHVNINRVEMMPVCQAFAPFAISREEPS